MSKYITLLQLSWQNGLVYRMSVLMWRLRQFLETILSLTVWAVIFDNNPQAFSYSREGMITYIFLVSFLQSIILASALNGLAQRVYSGEISNYLLKPINLFGYFAIEEVADKLKNMGFLIFEVLLLFLIFKPTLIIPQLSVVLFFIVLAFLGMLLNFCITLVFGSFGFWSPETWGPRFLFFMILNFTAGKLFPLDILPDFVQKILYFTPFPYLSFIQIQFFLGRLSVQETITHTIALCFWVSVIGIIAMKLWNKGLKSYESAGR